MQRPDLTQVDPAVRAYIEALEMELESLRGKRQAARAARAEDVDEPESFEPSEPPTTMSVVTISGAGLAKRTLRHLYGRQHRGGMGIYDLDTPSTDPPAWLVVADESAVLLLITNKARAFRLPVASLPASPVRSRGGSLTAALGLYPGEQLAVALTGERSTYAALLSERGWAVCLAGHILGENLRSSTVLYDVSKHGAPVAACWARSDQDLFMASRAGLAVRLAVKKVPSQGCLGIRLDPEDAAVAITAVGPEDQVLLLGADGRGTIRLLSGFAPFKSPGAGGKAALRTDRLVGAVRVGPGDDLFMISRLGKIIRFAAEEVPPKDGVVQGVHCMALRADEVVAIAATAVPPA